MRSLTCDIITIVMMFALDNIGISEMLENYPPCRALINQQKIYWSLQPSIGYQTEIAIQWYDRWRTKELKLYGIWSRVVVLFQGFFVFCFGLPSNSEFSLNFAADWRDWEKILATSSWHELHKVLASSCLTLDFSGWLSCEWSWLKFC